MARAAFVTIFAVTAVLIAAGAQGGEWRTYHNDRFGATADYPAGWRMQPPPENGDGATFVSPDGKARVLIFGRFLFNSRASEIADIAKPLDGEKVTYQMRGHDWIVVSGLSGDKIFYRKSLISCKDMIWNNIQIDYPAEDKMKYSAMVAHIAASLEPGAGIYEECR